MSLSRLTIALYVGAIFGSGVVVGVFGHRLYTVNSVDAKTAGRNPDEWRKRYVSEMKSRLKLRDDQLTQLNTILDETRDRVRAAKDRMHPEMEAIRQQQIQKVRAILDPAQVSEYDRMRAERERNMKKGPPPPPPPDR